MGLSPKTLNTEALGNSVRICERHYAHVMQSDLRRQLERSMPGFE